MLKRREFLQKASLAAGGVGLATGGTLMARSAFWSDPLPGFGQLPSGSRKERILASPQYRNGAFQNQSETPMLAPDSSYWQVSRQYLKKTEGREPAQALPTWQPTWGQAHSQPQFTWLGHSSYVWELPGGLTVVVDPVFHRASPVTWAGPSLYPGPDRYTVADLPEKIDILLITHDHYDHLDYFSFRELLPRVGKVVASLGVGSHLEYWGLNPAHLIELDWWESASPVEGLRLTATPARHFSGRGLTRGQTLWSAFVLETAGFRLFLGGDSGYDRHFVEIGERMGPFDVALLECGQYNPAWRFIHMAPEETAQAATDLRAQVLIPVHWAKFTLALHPWLDPIERVTASAQTQAYKLATPGLGQTLALNQLSYQPWWK